MRSHLNTRFSTYIFGIFLSFGAATFLHADYQFSTISGGVLSAPGGIAVDRDGNTYVAEPSNNTIRKITPAGGWSIFAGAAGISGSTDGAGVNARFDFPQGVAVDTVGNVYVADTGNNSIRKITPAGQVMTLAGMSGGGSGAGSGHADGTGASASFSLPYGVTVNDSGDLYVADTFNHTIRKITSAGVVTTLAGNAGVSGSSDGAGAAAQFNRPRSVAVDSLNNVYVADSANHTIRKISSSGVVTTLAGAAGAFGNTDGTGAAARFTFPHGVAVDGTSNIYVADTSNNSIRKITSDGVVSTVGGAAAAGNVDGAGTIARFSAPDAVTTDNTGVIYIADTGNNTLRKGVSAPGFVAQPLNQSVMVGSPITFTVMVSAAPTAIFQWQKEGANINGATDGSYTIPSATAGDAGNYRVIATNSAGTAISEVATLTVNSPPVITTQPLSQTATAGANISFTVMAGGTPSPTFQWFKNGVAIGGATGTTYTISKIQLSDAANYMAVASNIASSSSSNVATLTVNAATYPASFDALGYLARYPDLQTAFGNDLNAAWQHYLNYGINEGRVFDDTFRVDEYIGLYGDLQAAYGHDRQGAVIHWLTYGKAEGRLGRVPVTFDITVYLARYADLQAAFGSLPLAQRNVGVWNHYLNYGVYEGRNDGDFDVHAYLAQYGDLAAAFGTNLEAAAFHWYVYGRYEGRRIPEGFDVQGYLTRNPDVLAAYGRDLYGSWLHYWNYGLNEGRVYDDLFRVDEYLALYADLQAAFGTDRQAALLHWLHYGRAEGRKGRF